MTNRRENIWVTDTSFLQSPRLLPSVSNRIPRSHLKQNARLTVKLTNKQKSLKPQRHIPYTHAAACAAWDQACCSEAAEEPS